eukprot:1624322-Rhodomonas_salina.1
MANAQTLLDPSPARATWATNGMESLVPTPTSAPRGRTTATQTRYARTQSAPSRAPATRATTATASRARTST